jgi:hypothetical protein
LAILTISERVSSFFNKEINFTNTKKYFGYTKNNNQSIIITEQVIPEFNDEFAKRIDFLVSLVDNDFILVENIWFEFKDKSKQLKTKK